MAEVKKEKLAPCPDCGKAVNLVYRANAKGDAHYEVQCSSCPYTMKGENERERRDADRAALVERHGTVE